jgi:oligopeptide transport system substrate-binding protein
MVKASQYLNATTHLSEHVNQISQLLNQNNTELDTLTRNFESLFGLFSRGDELLKIVQDYSHRLKQDIDHLKSLFKTYEKDIIGINEKLTQSGDSLRAMITLLQDIKVNAVAFVESAQLLANLAKNTEIRAHHAKDEGKGLAIIAQECLSLAQRAQLPFHDFSTLLENLQALATPTIKDLDKIITLSFTSRTLLSESLESLRTIDETTSSLQNLISYVEGNSRLTKKLKTDVKEGLDSLKHQLVRSMNTLDDMTVRCSQISALALNANTLNDIITTTEQPVKGNKMESTKRHYLLRQLDYNLEDNIRTFQYFSIGKSPPYFPEEVYSITVDMKEHVTQLDSSLKDLKQSKECLGEGMAEVVDLSTQIVRFIEEAKTTYAHLNDLGDNLHNELRKIDVLVSQTTRILSKIKTLSTYARIEKGRSKKHLDIITPIVDEFVTLENRTESALLKLTPQLRQLRHQVQRLKKEKVTLSVEKMRNPDYSRIKLFLDDILRVFSEEADYINTISKVANVLFSGNRFLKARWKEYEEAIAELSGIIETFKLRKQEKSTIPYVKKGRDILSIGLASDLLTLKPDKKTDVNSHTVIGNYSCGLFQFGEGAEVIPALCEDYTISEDGTEYTFRMRRDIQYHNGQPLRIEHLKDALIQVFDGPNAHFFEMIQGSDEYCKSKTSSSVGIRILDNYTMQIKLDYPFLPILSNFATNIADPYIDDTLPIGTGAFKLVSRKKNEHVVLAANDSYFEGRPTIDELHFRIIGNEEEGYDLFRNGVLSVYTPTGKYLNKIKTETPRLLHTIPELSLQHLCINCQIAPFDKPAVRRALAQAIDKKRMVDTFLKGRAVPAKGIFPPSMRVYNHQLQGYKYDVSKAKLSLKEAGYPQGLPGIYPLDTSDSQSAIQRAEFVKTQLDHIGVSIEINPLPWQQLIEKTFAGESVLSFRGWVSDNGDPDNFLYPLFHSSSHGQTGNTFFFSSPEIDRLIDTARRIRNIDRRIRLYQQIEEKILEECPAVFLYHRLQTLAIQNDILGFKPHPLGLLRAKHIFPAGESCFVASQSSNAEDDKGIETTTLAHARL